MRFISLIVCFALISNFVFAQQAYTVVGLDFGFNPDSLYATVGDTVHFVNQGYHSMTEIDSVDWANNVSNHNGGFWVGFGAQTTDMWFVINQPGKYYYICDPHASLGMKGTIFVNAPTGIEQHPTPFDFNVINRGNGNIMLNYKKADRVELYNISGQQVFTSSLQLNETNTEVHLNLSTGVYLAIFRRGKRQLITKKIVVD